MQKIIYVSGFLLAGVVAMAFTWRKSPPVTSAAPAPFQTKYVVIMVIDGPRWSETFGDTSYQYIPNLGRNLQQQGVMFTNFYNNGVTTTNSGHASILTGNYEKLSNNGKEMPKNPSIFQYYLKEKNADRSEAWVLASKGKLEILGNCRNKDWWNTYMPYTYCGPNGNSSAYVADQFTVEKFKTIVGRHTPELMLVTLLEADARAHEKNKAEYLQGIKNGDQRVADMWHYIQSIPEMKDKTALFVTNDHGRHPDGHKEGYAEHGDGCEGCRHIMLVAIGPDFKKNVRSDKPAEMIDISATIAHLLGFDMKTGKGRVLDELFN